MSPSRPTTMTKEQTPPLVGDEDVLGVCERYADNYPIEGRITVNAMAMRRAVEPLIEADRQKTREVVQALVNCIRIADTYGQFRPMGPYHFDPESKYHERQQDEITAVALAKSQLQIEPTKP
jgi:hypothetical protein